MMRYSTEPRFRKYNKGYGFLSFAKNFGNKYRKKLVDTASKTGMDEAKIASKRVVQKTAEATCGLIGNKIADKITSIGKSKEKSKTKEKPEEIYILLYENGISKNYKFARKTSNNKNLPKKKVNKKKKNKKN